uniref:iron uptake porin n=1 Tax=Euhalothece natronophila TaxID=577489 RepID=UPI001FE54506|nr:iron uptake porin [Euhalothece natronophila]
MAQAEPVLAQSAGTSEQDLLQQIDSYNNEGGDSLGEINQVNSVFQLEDVSPDDWAFEALRNLVERYGCIAGYPDGTFRGNEPMTRYEFAAGLNACLQQIEQLIAADDQVTEEDLAALERLVQEFEAELTTLGTRVDDLEGRVGQLEDTQFSTTTKLSGGVDFALTSGFGSSQAVRTQGRNLSRDGAGNIISPDDTSDTDSNIGLLYKADLNFDASFTGRDQLRVRLRAADGDGFTQRATHESGAFRQSDPNSFTEDLTRLADIRDTSGDFELDTLTYRFPLGDRVTVVVGANDIDPDEAFEYNFGSGFILNDFIDGGDIYTLEGDNLGIFPGGRSDAGISTSINLTDRISVGAGYTASGGDARDPRTGLFQDYSAAANLNYAGDRFDIGLGYGRTAIGGGEFGIAGAVAGIPVETFTQDAVGLRGAARLGRRTEVGGWVSYVDRNFDFDRGSQDDWGFGANVAFFDVGKEGSKLSLGFASPAQASDFEFRDRGTGQTNTIELDRAYIAEISYDFPVNDNISVIPGFMAVFNPENNSDNDTVYVGVLQTSFSF